MLDYMYRIPSDESISRVIISKKDVEENLKIEDTELKAIEQHPQDEEIAS